MMRKMNGKKTEIAMKRNKITLNDADKFVLDSLAKHHYLSLDGISAASKGKMGFAGALEKISHLITRGLVDCLMKSGSQSKPDLFFLTPRGRRVVISYNHMKQLKDDFLKEKMAQFKSRSISPQHKAG